MKKSKRPHRSSTFQENKSRSRASRIRKQMGFGLRVVSVCGLAAALHFGNAACVNRDVAPLGNCVTSGSRDEVAILDISAIDLLFVIDKSNSMEQEQRAIAREIPRIFRILATGGTEDDNIPDFPPVPTNIGVLTTDAGASYPTGLQPPTPFGCGDLNDPTDTVGDNGILVSEFGPTAIYDSNDDGLQNEDCSELTAENDDAAFISFTPDLAEPENEDERIQLENEIACRAQVGSVGCGFEQQLDSMIKGLVGSDAQVSFFNSGDEVLGGQGGPGGPNDGFLRDDSLLVVIMVTDEDDCSTTNPAALFAENVVNEGDGNPYQTLREDQDLRCHNVDGRNYDDVLHPTQRYVDELLKLRDFPGAVVYSVITGVPQDLISEDQENFSPEFIQGILDDPRLEKKPIQEDVNGQTRFVLEPSCQGEGDDAKARPPRRILEVAKGIAEAGGNAVVQSICNSSYTGAINTIVKKIAEVLNGSCLERELRRNPDGRVNCEVFERLPEGGPATCAEAGEGREDFEVEDDGTVVCKINQVITDGESVPTEGVGWYYDDFSTELEERCAEGTPARAALLNLSLVNGSTLSFNCLVPVQSTNTNDQVGVGTACEVGSDDMGDEFCDGGPNTSTLICDGTSRTCQIKCLSDADCTGNLVCDDRIEDEERRVCLNPICGASTIQ